MYSKESTKRPRSSSYTALHYCAVCGDAFHGIATAKYCSARCTNDAHMEARRKKAQLKRENAKNCIVCNNRLAQGESKHKVRLYCSDACKQKAYRQRLLQKT